jgi:hypothetical protein
MKKILFATLVLFLLVGCNASEKAVQTAIAETQARWTDVPTNTPYPTYTDKPPRVVTRILTLTPSPTPAFSATASNTRTPTVSPLFRNRGDGFYLVGVDIAPGVWRSNGTGTHCYWSVTTRTGDIIDNHFGQAGGTAYIPASGFQVEFNTCGTWTFIGNP